MLNMHEIKASRHTMKSISIASSISSCFFEPLSLRNLSPLKFSVFAKSKSVHLDINIPLWFSKASFTSQISMRFLWTGEGWGNPQPPKTQRTGSAPFEIPTIQCD